MANFEINEEQAALIRELRKLETSDPVHANVYNALFEKLINNDAFLERLANKMVEKSMLCHVLDSVNAQQVLAADVGPKITAITNELKENVSVLNTKITDFDSRIHIDDTTTIANLSAQIKTGFQCVYLKSANLKPNYGHGVILELNNASGLYAIRIISWDDDTPNIGMYYGIKLSPSTLIKDVSYFSLQVNR